MSNNTSATKHTVVITGATGGIGFQSALGIAKTRSDARIVITGRNKERGEAAQRSIQMESGNDAVEFIIADVSSLKGVDALRADLCERLDRIDVLINNVGYMGNKKVVNEDNIPLEFMVNVVAPRRLTMSVLPLLKAAGGKARVLNISGGDKPAAIDVNNLFEEKGFRGLMTYTHSKSILESLSMLMSKELEKEGITVNVIFPGRASTAMTRSLSFGGLPGPMKCFLCCFKCMFMEDNGKSAKAASKCTIFGATSSTLDGVTGKYFGSTKGDNKEQKLHPTAYDPNVQATILAKINSVAPEGTLE
jgi:NAD(P)-dependent dehydrogenase (short-subunit alcohol dehydrogenase family)